MSLEGSLAAAAAIDANESQSTVAVNQAIQAAQQWTMAQNFELSINEAAQSLQTGAAACQQADLSCKKAAIQNNELSGQFIPEVQVWPSDHSHDLSKQVIGYVDQYSQRAKNFTTEIDGMLTKAEDVSATSATTLSTPARAFDPSEALRLMQRTYEFALETYLISNASSLSTRIFNQLMKEQ
jgi:hypothetical protein